MQLLAFDHEGASNCVFDKEGLVRGVRETFNREERLSAKQTLLVRFPDSLGNPVSCQAILICH
jgi:hypothetical protein